MPIHDWKRVDAGTFHAFHTLWISEMMKALNAGLLPKGYYAMAEQVATHMQAEVLTLQGPTKRQPPPMLGKGGVLLADAPPGMQLNLRPDPKQKPKRPLPRGRHLVIRHVTRHQVVALLEIASPANKDRRGSVRDFTEKIVRNLEAGIHVLLLDVLPPGRHDPKGLHGAVWAYFDRRPYQPPVEGPLTLAAYLWNGEEPRAFVEPTAVGHTLIDMPLFLTAERYIRVPLEATYQSAYAGMPEIWRDVLEGRHEEPLA